MRGPILTGAARRRGGRALAAAALLCAALVACGGGDGGGGGTGIAGDPADDAPAPSPAGLWRGVTADGRALEGVVLGDGAFSFLYSGPDGAGETAGVVAGEGAVEGGSLTASRALDYRLGVEGGASAFALEATFSARATLDGTLTYESGETSSFTSAHVEGSSAPADLGRLAGDYTGTVANASGDFGAGLSIGADGAFTGDTDDGCAFSGAFAARADANAYEVAIDAAGEACAPGTDALVGLAFLDPDAGDGLVAVLRDDSLATVTVFGGRRGP